MAMIKQKTQSVLDAVRALRDDECSYDPGSLYQLEMTCAYVQQENKDSVSDGYVYLDAYEFGMLRKYLIEML